MRIVVAAVSANLSMSGTSRHTANLVRCLLSRPEIVAVHLLVGPWEQKYMSEAIGREERRLHVHGVTLGPGRLSRNLWYYRSLPALAKQLRGDLVHLAYPSLIRRGAFPCPVVATLHDLYSYDIPSNFGFPKAFFNRIILKECIRNSDAIACVSDSTQTQLKMRMPKALSKAVTVNNCVEVARTEQRPAFAVSWADRPFLLCVAQHRRNKNIPIALDAFRILLAEGTIEADTRFLLIGICGPETRRIEKAIRDNGLGRSVLLANGITDSEMNWCYRNCTLLVAPSSIEGFGLPVAEGRLAGCRILCADIPAFREVGGKGCSFVKLGPNAEKNFAVAAAAILRQRRPLPASMPHLSSVAIGRQYFRLYRRLTDSRMATETSHRRTVPPGRSQEYGDRKQPFWLT